MFELTVQMTQTAAEDGPLTQGGYSTSKATYCKTDWRSTSSATESPGLKFASCRRNSSEFSSGLPLIDRTTSPTLKVGKGRRFSGEHAGYYDAVLRTEAG